MPDKSALQISEELRQYIESMVEEVVLKGKDFESHKKYLPRFCRVEGIEFESFEKNLTDFFDIMEEWKAYHTKGNSMMAKLLGRACYLSETFIGKLLEETKIDNGDYPKGQGTFAVETEVKEKKEEKQTPECTNTFIPYQVEFGELMADLIPDLVNKKERLDVHMYYVKKLAHDSGWDEEEVGTALSDFLSMYNDLQKEIINDREKKLLAFQASFAHIDSSILDKIL